jgi:glycosyltransferase involved in cell wall biosynthesis
MPKVSVVIASYNHEKYVSDAIQSVLNQTYQDFEIIITDDGSVDGTVSKVKEFTDPRIKLFTFEKNQGAVVAASHSIQNATGEYISDLSSDDIFLHDKLEKQVRFLDEHPDIGAVFGYAHIINEDGSDFSDVKHFFYNIFNQPNRTRYQWLNYFFYYGNCLCCPSDMIRRRCYEDIGYGDARFAQLPDLDFWIKLCMKYEIHVLPEKLIKFRKLPGGANASGDRVDSRIRKLWEKEQVLKNFLSIKSTDDLCRIFPAVKKYKETIEDDLIPFFIARLALETNSPVHHRFAVGVVFDLLGDAATAQKLEQKFGFTYRDFIRLTGEIDIYNTEIEYGERAEMFRLKEIEGSLSWKVMNKCFSFIDKKIFPRHTRRGRAYRKIFERLKQ